MKYAVLFLLLFISTEVLSQSFYLRSATQNDIHVKVWVDGKLINDHIMKPGDWLHIKSNTGCWIWFDMIGDYCDDYTNPTFTTKYGSATINSDGTYEMYIEKSAFSRWKKIGIAIYNPPCPKKPQA